jgi:hypothetical protein
MENKEDKWDRFNRKKIRQQAVEAVNPPEAPASPVVSAPAVVAAHQPELLLVPTAVDFPPSEAEMAEYYEEKAKAPAKQSAVERITDPFQLKTLYVGCMPMNEAVVLLDNWLSPLLASAAQSLGVPHYGMAEYGKGKPALAALVQHKATTEGVPLVLVADPRMPSTDVALEVLRPLYDRIVVRFG